MKYHEPATGPGIAMQRAQGLASELVALSQKNYRRYMRGEIDLAEYQSELLAMHASHDVALHAWRTVLEKTEGVTEQAP